MGCLLTESQSGPWDGRWAVVSMAAWRKTRETCTRARKPSRLASHAAGFAEDI